MQELKIITLEDILPKVFAGEKIRSSHIWRCECRFERGERYMIEAPSGGGKSSLMAYIYGARKDYEGKLKFNGEDCRNYSLEDWQELRRFHIAYLPQELDLFPELTCYENIMLKNKLTNHLSAERIEELLERLGIASRRDYPAGRMSIGQQQRLAIIRSLCMPFDFIMLDEPVSHLDEENNRIVAEIVNEEASHRGAGVISTSVGNPLMLEGTITLSL